MFFRKKRLSNQPKRFMLQTKTDVYHIDDIWSLDILDLKEYREENNRSHRHVLEVICNFFKFGWTGPLKNKIPQTIKDYFGNILLTSKTKPN